MISSKEASVLEVVKRKTENDFNTKRKKDGSLDMRYRENIKSFCEEYKIMMLLENRKHNKTCHEINTEYRKEILNLSEKQFMEYSLKN